jgi:hypothetical protein
MFLVRKMGAMIQLEMMMKIRRVELMEFRNKQSIELELANMKHKIQLMVDSRSSRRMEMVLIQRDMS